MDKPEIFVCECGSLEHQVAFWHDEEYNELYLEVHLVHQGFFRRLKAGLKYIFGYKSRYGEFDSIIFNPDDAPRIIEILQKLKS